MRKTAVETRLRVLEMLFCGLVRHVPEPVKAAVETRLDIIEAETIYHPDLWGEPLDVEEVGRVIRLVRTALRD